MKHDITTIDDIKLLADSFYGRVRKDTMDQIIQRNSGGILCGRKAAKAKWQGERMAEMFQHKIEYYRNNSITSIV